MIVKVPICIIFISNASLADFHRSERHPSDRHDLEVSAAVQNVLRCMKASGTYHCCPICEMFNNRHKMELAEGETIDLGLFRFQAVATFSDCVRCESNGA